ncbi:MAG: hypothetical protein ABI539_15155 [Acidobacteriota bacterium]
MTRKKTTPPAEPEIIVKESELNVLKLKEKIYDKQVELKMLERVATQKVNEIAALEKRLAEAQQQKPATQ